MRHIFDSMKGIDSQTEKNSNFKLPYASLSD